MIANIITGVTRRELLEEGLQKNITETHPDLTRMYKYPVFFSTEVLALVREATAEGVEAGNDEKGVIYDILYMSIKGRVKNLSPAAKLFEVIVTGTSRPAHRYEDKQTPVYRLLVEVGPTDIDDPSPAVTIMFSEEN